MAKWRAFMNRNELANEIYVASHISGFFKLRSGKFSREYFDKYLFESDPRLLKEIAKNMSKLIPTNTDMLAGLEMGGIPVATALSLLSGIPVIFVRKKAKEYGTGKLAEGIEVGNKEVCIIEDVVTTGGQILLSNADLKQLGAKTKTVLCVIERGNRCRDFLKKEGLELLPLFTMDELEKNGKV
jgi:orotate phosphoribosyltransferase